MEQIQIPNSAEAERAILGGVVLDNGLISQAIELVRPEDFYTPSHRRIFTAMVALFERGTEINPILIGDELKKEKALEAVGGISFITNLTYGLPHSTSITHYANIVIEMATARAALKAADKISAQIQEGKTRAAIEWAIKAFGGFAARSEGRGDGLSVVRIADVQAEPICWLWFPFIPLRKVTLLEGEEGLGKSYLTCAIACAISRGRGLPGADSSTPANVLIMSAEDGLGDTIRPRLESMGADLERVFAVDQAFTLDRKGMLLLEDAIIKYRPALVVIDPLFSYTGAKIDINRANESRAVSAQLAALADKHNLAFLLVRHIGKSKGNGDPRAAGLGSIDWRAAARSVLLVGQDRDTNQRGLVQTKHNLTPPDIKPIGFEIKPGPTRDAIGEFLWTTGCTLTTATILASVGNEEERQARNDAAAVLRDILQDGAKPADMAKAEMREAGFTDDQTRRARERLGVVPRKTGGNFGKDPGCWVWQLAEDGTEDGKVLAEDGKKTKLCHLQANGDDKGAYGNVLAEDGKQAKPCHLQDRYSPIFSEQWRQQAWESWNPS